MSRAVAYADAVDTVYFVVLVATFLAVAGYCWYALTRLFAGPKRIR